MPMPPTMDGTYEATNRYVLVRNVDALIAPPFAVLEHRGYDATTGAYLVGRPTRSGQTAVLFNGPSPIDAYDSANPENSEGQALADRQAVAAWTEDGSGEDPVEGEEWGVEKDSWHLVRSYPGFKILARPEGEDFNTVLVEPMDLTRIEIVRATGEGTPGGGVPEDYYPASLITMNPTDATWVTVTDEVWYHALDKIAPQEDDDIPVRFQGFGSGRKVYSGRLGGPGSKRTGCTPEGWGWSKGLWTTECLYFEVLNLYGACSGIDDTQWAYLRYDGVSKWISQRWNCLTLAWEDWEFEYDGGTGQIEFTKDPTTGLPTLTIVGAPSVAMLACGGPGVVVFTIGGPEFCGGGGSSGLVACKNFAELRVSCTCCPMDGWEGPGYYCIADADEDCDVAVTMAVYLYESDKCRTDIIICSCRFDTLAEAEAECGSGGAVTASCPPKADFFANPPTVTVSNKTGDCTCLEDTPTPWVDGVDSSIMYFQPSGCVGGVQFKLECVGGEYTLTTATGGVSAICIAYTATPFSITFRVIGMGANCNYGSGGFDVTIDAP